MNHCLFLDSDHAPPYNTVNLDHQKVVHYNTYVDAAEADSGHGSMVASIAAGQSLSSGYCGSASDSKISFFDVGDADSVLSVPPDLNNNLLQPLYDTGAAVSSHSWGSSTSSYTSDSRSVDLFMLQNSDALVFMAGKGWFVI